MASHKEHLMKGCLISFLVVVFCCSYCNGESRQPWSSICPSDQCEEIVLSRVVKSTQTFYLNVREGRVFCLKPLPRHSLKGLKHVWHNYRVSIATSSIPDSTLCYGNSSSSVLRILQGKGGGSWYGGREARETEVRSSPYEVNCVGVKLLSHAKNGGNVTVHFTQSFQIAFVIILSFGILLYRSASYLTKNATFYYSGGIAIGIVASLLILLYIFSKFVPKKNVLGIGVLIGGYSFAGYLAHWIYSQGLEFVKENWTLLLVYVIVAGLISFAVLYRIGPAHPRSLQLMQWFLQLIGLGLVFLSFVQFYQIGLIAVILVVTWHNIPISITYKLWKLLCRPFSSVFVTKPQRKLLTLEEYEEQGEVETEKALQELRKHCRSNSKFWEGKLEDLQHQSKFLEFLSGKDHVNDRERDRHEVEFPSLYEDDTSSTSSNDSSMNTSNPSSTSSPYLSSSQDTSGFNTPSRHYY